MKEKKCNKSNLRRRERNTKKIKIEIIIKTEVKSSS